MKGILEVKRTNEEDIAPNAPVTFNIASPYSEEINYDPLTGEITLTEIGRYSIRWWVATENTLIGCIHFSVKSSQGDILESCSSTKRGQLSGFGVIDAQSANVKLTLENYGNNTVILSKTSPVKAALSAIRIPDDGVIPSFDVNEVITLEPDELATADIQEDTGNPNNWLFSFGIPVGKTGNPGITPHIDTDTGNWFIGDTNTNIHAQGAEGPKGDPGPAGMPEYYNFSITNADTVSNPVNFIIGSIRFAFSYYNATTLQLRIYPAQPGTNILYDYRRLSFFDAALQVETRNGMTLTDVGWTADDTILSQSNEWQSSILRQRNPDDTWSLCEYRVFGSASLSRITLWVNWIYKDIIVDEWQ